MWMLIRVFGCAGWSCPVQVGYLVMVDAEVGGRPSFFLQSRRDGGVRCGSIGLEFKNSHLD